MARIAIVAFERCVLVGHDEFRQGAGVGIVARHAVGFRHGESLMRLLERRVIVVAVEAQRGNGVAEQAARAGTVRVVADQAIIVFHRVMDADPAAPRIHGGMTGTAQLTHRLDELIGMRRCVRVVASQTIAGDGRVMAKRQIRFVGNVVVAFETEFSHFVVQQRGVLGRVGIVARRTLARFQRRVHVPLLERNIQEVRPNAEIFKVSAKTGTGMNAWLDYLQSRFAEKQG